MKIEELQAYEVVARRRIEDLNSESYILCHRKTGARIALLSNDDENKVFYIGFRTPPKDSTGVPHIIEHSVTVENVNDRFGHFLDCEAHTDVWRELFKTYNATNEI